MVNITHSPLKYSPEHAKQPARPYQKAAVKVAIDSLDHIQPILVHVATGGGKTRIGNDVVVKLLRNLDEEDWILWIAPNWELLMQAATDLVRRNRGFEEKIARLGGGKNAMPGVSGDFEDINSANVIFTTTDTYLSRAKRGELRGWQPHPSLIIWDECHKGENAKTGKALFDGRRWPDVPVLGLTATPRCPEDSRYQIVYSKTFAELIQEGYLAAPIPVVSETGTRWTPEFNYGTGDVTGTSLKELAAKRNRNKVIVEHYKKNHRKYGKTLIFCCDINHSNKLANMFSSQLGVPARSINCRNQAEFNCECISAFKNDKVQVVTNVSMLTHGIDIPDIKTIFLCRPTGSDILFSQMVGRGARLDDKTGKTKFYLVEFTDNIEKHGDKLTTTSSFFRGAGLSLPDDKHIGKKRKRYEPVDKIEKHKFNPYGLPTWIPDLPEIPEALRGLWFRKDQTFGIEIELTRNDYSGHDPDGEWLKTAEALRQSLVNRLGDRVAGKCFKNPRAVTDYSVWNVVYDRTCGWEVTSRILNNEEGYAEIADACEAIDEAIQQLELTVNSNTALHVHFGWKAMNRSELTRAVLMARLFEPALATLVSPSRIANFDDMQYDTDEPNEYCRPISYVLGSDELDETEDPDDYFLLLEESDDSRYLTFNLASLQNKNTVEVRLHNGTTNAGKILLWLSLWQQILWAAADKFIVEKVPDCSVIVPNGDILALARKYLPTVQQEQFIARLKARREEIVRLWRNNPDLQEWVKYAEKW